MLHRPHEIGDEIPCNWISLAHHIIGSPLHPPPIAGIRIFIIQYIRFLHLFYILHDHLHPWLPRWIRYQYLILLSPVLRGFEFFALDKPVIHRVPFLAVAVPILLAFHRLYLIIGFHVPLLLLAPLSSIFIFTFYIVFIFMPPWIAHWLPRSSPSNR